MNHHVEPSTCSVAAEVAVEKTKAEAQNVGKTTCCENLKAAAARGVLLT